jgi:hypothetical protein
MNCKVEITPVCVWSINCWFYCSLLFMYAYLVYKLNSLYPPFFCLCTLSINWIVYISLFLFMCLVHKLNSLYPPFFCFCAWPINRIVYILPFLFMCLVYKLNSLYPPFFCICVYVPAWSMNWRVYVPLVCTGLLTENCSENRPIQWTASITPCLHVYLHGL